MKTIKIIQLVILLAVVGILVVVLVAGMMGRLPTAFASFIRNPIASPSVLILDQSYDGRTLNKVDSQLNSSSLEFEVSQDDQLRVVYYGPESETDDPTVRVNFSDQTLEITQRNRISFLRSITKEKVVVYLPKNFASDIACQSASGNIIFQEHIKLNSLRLKLSSGNIIMQDIVTPSLDIEVSSGKVTAAAVQADEYRFKISSGNLKLTELAGTGETISTSGNITVDHLFGGGSVKSTSGNTTIGLDKLVADLEISLTSGNATVQLLMPDPDLSCELDVLSGTIRSNFGNVSRNVAGASLNHDFGDGSGYHLSVKSTSGNLKIETADNG